MHHRTLSQLLAATALGLFVPAVLAQSKPAPSPARTGERLGDAYVLHTCPVSGEELGGMGDAVVKVYDGREVRFCCDKCVASFEKDVTASWIKVDAATVKDQLPFYPLNTSVVSGKKLDKPVDFVWNNRLVRLADESEKAEFLKDTKKYITALDKAVIEKQSASYALTTCPMMGDELDPADTKSVVIANRLIKVCCSKCVGKVRRDPTKALAAIYAPSGAK